MKITKKVNKDKSIAKYELGTFCEQYRLSLIAPSNKKKKNQKPIIGTQIGTPVDDTPNTINTNSKTNILKQISFMKNPSPTRRRGNPQENSTPKTKNKKGIATSVANSVIMQINVESRKQSTN